MIKATIVIPTCDRASLLPRALSSAIKEAGSFHEVIVVNDGKESIDFIRTSLSKSENIKFLSTDGYQGVSAARNLAIAEASGEIICFLDDDDALMPGFLFSVCLEMSKGWSFIWAGKLNHSIKKGKYKIKPTVWRKAAFESPLSFITEIAASCGLTIHRSMFEKYGVFDESLKTSEDRDLLLRLIQNGATFNCIPFPLVSVYEDAPVSLSRIRTSPSRAKLSALDDEIVIDRYGSLIFSDKVLAVKYLRALAGKYHNAGDFPSYVRVMSLCSKYGAINLKLISRALRLSFKWLFGRFVRAGLQKNN